VLGGRVINFLKSARWSPGISQKGMIAILSSFALFALFIGLKLYTQEEVRFSFIFMLAYFNLSILMFIYIDFIFFSPTQSASLRQLNWRWRVLCFCIFYNLFLGAFY